MMSGKIDNCCCLASARETVDDYVSLLTASILIKHHIFKSVRYVHKAVSIVDDLFSEVGSEFLLIDSELRFNLFQSPQKVLHFYFQLGLIQLEFLTEVEDVSRPANGVRRCTLNQCFDFCASKVFGQLGKFLQMAAGMKEIVLSEILRMDVENLLSSLGIWQVDFDVDLEPSRSQHCLIQQILTIGHSNYEDVVKGFHTIDVCEQLVDNLVGHLRTNASTSHASLLADCIDLVEDYYVQRTFISHFLLICSSLCEQFTYVFLRFSHKFAEYFRTIDDFEVLHVESFGQLPCNQGFASTRRTIQQYTLDVFDTESSNSVS